MKNIYFCCRTSHEVRGLKSRKFESHILRRRWCRTSHEVRGLKYLTVLKALIALCKSHLTRGAWIEIEIIAHNI